MKMISMVAAATLALSPLAANAGGLAAVVEEPMMMDDMKAAEGSVSGSILISLLFLAFVAAAAGESEADDTE